MAGGSFQQVYVRCPFYRFDDGKSRITCEGILDGSNLALIYRSRQDFRIQMDVFCCQHYKKCEVYAMLMDKYSES